MDQFLDKHKKIDKDLQKNPALINDNNYLQHHKDLQAFLTKNPQVSEEFKENPSLFMQKEAEFKEKNHRMNDLSKHKTKLEQKEDKDRSHWRSLLP